MLDIIEAEWGSRKRCLVKRPSRTYVYCRCSEKCRMVVQYGSEDGKLVREGKLFLHEEKDDAGKEVCVVCCVLCVGGVIKGPMPPAPCPQPHAPSPMPPTPCLSRRARRAHSHGFKHVTKSIQAPSPMPHAPSPMPLEESKELQVSMPAR